MAITLGALRQWCRERVYPDSTGLKAQRDFRDAINAGFAFLWTARDWEHAQAERLLQIDPSVSGSNLAVVQDANTFTLSAGENWLAKWVGENTGYRLHVDAEGDHPFELATVDGPLLIANGRPGDRWIRATAGGLAWTVFHEKIDLPDDISQAVRKVTLTQTRVDLRHVEPVEMDDQRRFSPNTKGTDPYVYTTRNNKIEFWPPTSVRRTLGLTYVRGVPTYPTAAEDPVAGADSVEVDWPEAHKMVLLWAIALQGTAIQGAKAPMDIATVSQQYYTLLGQFQGKDQTRSHAPGPLLPRIRGVRSIGNWGRTQTPYPSA